MSLSTATISSKTSSNMNNNDRKRPISSSIHPSPSPPLAKRNNLSTKNKKNLCQNERSSRSKQQTFRHTDNKSSSSESSRSSSNSNQDFDIKNSDDILSTKKAHLNSNNNNPLSDTIYTKKNSSIALIVKPTSSTTTIDQRNLLTNYDNNDHVVLPSSLMTIVKTPDVTKKSTKLVKVVVPQSTINLNTNSSSSSSSIKMLPSGDGYASALRVPRKIQLTKTSFISSDKIEKSINSEQITFSLSSTTLLDIPIDTNDKQDQQEQQTIVDYNSSTTLPPTPPPPVIDTQRINNQQEQQENKSNELSINNKLIEENNCSNRDEQINGDEDKRKSHSSSLSDWSVPPTSELSPTSLTSSSPDLPQNPLPSDDSIIVSESTINRRKSIKRRYHSVSSFPVKTSQQSDDISLKPIKSKSLTGLSNSSNTKSISVHNKTSLTSSPILQLSSSQRMKKRRHDNESLIVNQKVKTKQIKIDLDDQLIIQNLLNEIIERILITNDEKDSALESLLIQPVTHVKQTIAIDVIPNVNPQLKSSVNKKVYSSSQSVDSTGQNESRPMLMTSKELDELAYLLHANAQRGDYERMNNPTKVEERMREMWSQMSNQKKNIYYKRVIQIYKRPNRDVIITTSSSSSTSSPILEKKSFSSNDLIDNTNSTSMNPLSVELNRQTSTPLSFHSVCSSTPDESPSKTTIFTDIVNELIKGAKGLDKLSCTHTDFVNSIESFVQSTMDKQNQIVINLEKQVEKKCSTQLNRASIFWKQKINYFATKHQINSSNELMNELTLIVKYFYLYVLSLNCRKQEVDFEFALADLLNGNLTFIDPLFCSSVLTSIIEDLILPSTLANDYLASQFLIIENIEYSLPFIRNIELENELLNKNEAFLSINPFTDCNDLDDYLNRCEHMTTTTIPCYPIQQSSSHSSMYYPTYHHPPPPPQYYYPSPSQSSDMNNYYYNSSPIYPYGQSTTYYHPSSSYNNSEQFKYYYNPQQSSSYAYPSQSNSTSNDIPSLANNSSHHRTYRQMNPTLQRTYSNPQQQQPGTPAVYDPTTTAVSPQSKSINTINTNYPP